MEKVTGAPPRHVSRVYRAPYLLSPTGAPPLRNCFLRHCRPTFLLSDNTSAPKRSPLRHNLAIGEPCLVSFRCYRGSRDIRDRAERGDISRCWSLLWYWWGKEKMWTCGRETMIATYNMVVMCWLLVTCHPPPPPSYGPVPHVYTSTDTLYIYYSKWCRQFCSNNYYYGISSTLHLRLSNCTANVSSPPSEQEKVFVPSVNNVTGYTLRIPSSCEIPNGFSPRLTVDPSSLLHAIALVEVDIQRTWRARSEAVPTTIRLALSGWFVSTVTTESWAEPIGMIK